VAINAHLHRNAPWRQDLAAREERFPPPLELLQCMMSADAVLLAALDIKLYLVIRALREAQTRRQASAVLDAVPVAVAGG